MRVIDIPQKTPEWLQWRAGGVTASDAAAVLGRSPYKTPWRLWAERTGLVAPEDLSNAFLVRRGNALEDQARRDFEDRHGTCLLPLCGESLQHPAIRASFDGIDDDGCPVELKIPWDAVYEEVVELQELSTAYRLYWVQLQSQLYVTEAERGWLVFYRRPGVVAEFEIFANEQFLGDSLVPGLLDFWEAVRTKREPPPDPARDIYIPRGEALADWTRLAGEYRKHAAEKARLDALGKQAQVALDGIENRLVATMGDFLLAEAADLRVLRYRKAGAIDYKAALAELLPEVAPATL
jgi:putative phage-type endonuclease